MNKEFYTTTNEEIKLVPGWPSLNGIERLSSAESYYVAKDFGTILLQEIRTTNFVIRYFVFRLYKSFSFSVKEKNEGLQSLLTLKGEWHLADGPQLSPIYNHGKFLLLNAGEHTIEAVVNAPSECHLLNVYYPPETYSELFPFFPALKADIKKSRKKPFYFFSSPRPVKFSVLDAVHELLLEEFTPLLQNYYRDLKLREALFIQLVQAYATEEGRRSTAMEREIAEKARTIIEKDLSVHHPNEAIAKKVGWSESTLKRAFRQEFGLGMYEYLRRKRMHKAREMLLQGQQVKTAAFTIGMRPSNFTSEFQKYFGYKATSLRNGKR